MTSGSSSLNNIFSLQKELIRRRGIVAALSFLYFFVADIIGLVLVLSNRKEQFARLLARTVNPDVEGFRIETMNVVSGYLGVRTGLASIVLVIAAVLALEGFSYLFSAKQLDFYESQPVLRKKRFFAICLNSLLIYLVPAALGMAGACGILAAEKLLTPVLLADLWIGLFRTVLLFAAVFSVTLCAVMMSGNVVMAGILTFFLMVIEPIGAVVLDSLKNMYYSTYVSEGFARMLHLSPVADYFQAFSRLSRWVFLSQLRRGTAASFSALVFKAAWKRDLKLVIFTIVLTGFSYYLYKKRRNETAGENIIYPVMRPVLKFVCAVIGSLCCFVLARDIFGIGRTTRTGILVLAVSTVIICCIAEVVYARNIRALFHKAWQIPIAAAVSFMILAVFHYDLTGFDSYVPDPSKVASGAFWVSPPECEFYVNGVFDGNLDRFGSMTLTDTQAVCELGRLGQETCCAGQSDELFNGVTVPGSYGQGWNGQVLYRLNSGREVRRRIILPYDTDPALLDRLTGSKEYRDGVFRLNEMLDGLPEGTVPELYLESILESVPVPGEYYPAVIEAYRKDLESYCYSAASKDDIRASLQLNISFADGQQYAGGMLWIFSSFENTIRVLEDAVGFPVDPSPEELAETIESVTVWHHDYTAQEAAAAVMEPKMIAPTAEYDPAYHQKKVYTDPEQIKEILQAAYYSNFPLLWKNEQEFWDRNYEVTIQYKDQQYTQYYRWSVNAMLKNAEMPDFIVEDLAFER